MPMTDHETGLWMRSLGAQQGGEDAERYRERLVVGLESFRARASELAGEIARDHPDFTVHDDTHFDALWGLADQIAGPDFDLTPTEAFVFGGAALIHDLGMASAAYVDGNESLEEDPRWPDRVVFALRQKLGRSPTKEEIEQADEETMRLARGAFLRELHAEHAEALATASWSTPDGRTYELLEDADLRNAFGSTIGQVAHSHWWSPNVVGERLRDKLGAPAGCPSDWTIRPMVVACLLRLADASHIDSSRAPRFLRALRKPGSAAAPHWDFQANLSQPYQEGDRFVFTGSAKFGIDESAAWWLCADTLKAVDREMRGVDALLADRGEQRFAIRGVVGADDLGRLAERVRPDGWTPADAQVRVSDVVHLVERLGGRELYGSTPHVPLRELLQNASDAVRARRAIGDEEADGGSIVVRLAALDADGCRRLEVEDSGVGMSRPVLTDHLLDFGRSFWQSESVLTELPGLLASGFEPTGRFGIGFFSIFMWGDEVTVASRRYDAGNDQTNVLEFSQGIANRPLLRQAAQAERMKRPGTRVRVLLDAEILWRLGIDEQGAAVPAMAALCSWLAPALDVELRVEAEGEGGAVAVAANDWQEMPMDELCERIRQSPLRFGSPAPASEEEQEVEQEVEVEATADRDLEEPDWSPPREHARVLSLSDGTIVGRAHLNSGNMPEGVVTIGGLRSSLLSGLSGVLQGKPVTASRHFGIPLVPSSSLADWASGQAALMADGASGETAVRLAEIVRACGGDTGRLPIALTGEGFLSRDRVVAWASQRDEVLALQDAALSIDVRSYGEISCADGVAAVGMVPEGLVSIDYRAGQRDHPSTDWPEPDGLSDDYPPASTLFAVLVEAIAEAWDVPGEEIEEQARVSNEPRVVGSRDDQPVELTVVALRRPGP